MQSAVDVALTCVGRKSYLVGIFEQSNRLGTLAAVDANPEANIQFYADEFRVVPPVVDEPEAYVDSLVEFCEELDLDCIVPQNDLDLIVVAEARERFREHGIEVAGAPAPVTRAVGDKREMVEWMERHGLAYPRTWSPSEVPDSALPVVVKARRGQGAARFDTVRDPERLEELDPEQMVAQSQIDGIEYNLDILRSAAGEVVSVVPKRKLEMRNGATDKARSVEAPDLLELGCRIGRATEHVGSIDVDVMVDPETERAWVIDINPRVGGGFPYTSRYAPRYVDALLAICNGENPEPFVGEYRRGVRIDREFRYFEVDSG